MTEFPETNESEGALTLTKEARQITDAELTISSRKAYKAAVGMGWETRAWLAVGEVAPTFYVASSEEDAINPHNAGDMRPGSAYTARLFTIEARDPLLPIGFRAIYVGKVFHDSPKKPVAGAFDCAFVVDPIGIEKTLQAVYKPIKVTRGKYETEASYKNNLNRRQAMADEMNAAYNDDAVVFDKTPMFSQATDFTDWLAQWRPFY